MARGKKLAPRKQPTQERSRATVDALVQATADLLVRDGYEKLTTNRVAERAGVNIASLYQFFPGKDALVAEVRRRHVEAQQVAMREAMKELQGKGLEETVRALVTMGVAAHAVDPKLHHALTEELPARVSRVGDPKDPVLSEARKLMEGFAGSGEDVERTLWMVDTVAHAAIHRGVIERPEDLESGALTEELVTLLVRYLRRR
ncbi:TetR/AcrR family transcriptional regulator [Pyxidicoccus parkwayensis]|uniref:TetR/AcrR family transcriptional regulator n=1 Tax=Pyxidicoccus parkwayensis TaxID=2813578 RepID=A0ABX7NNL2_9BACT|nr:TetR/AcrR family transcriptional regulator [Pyxidicoccus parkwaysis]QSQ20445.1 TetR/AcrR family transcriptional regulator [Pyxidicoccus parkwaysis]